MSADPVHGPATRAARRARSDRDAARVRAYPRSLRPGERDADAVLLAVSQALSAVDTRAGAAAVLRTGVHDLGGGLVPARLVADPEHVLSVDVSLGVGEPQLVVVDPLSVAAMDLAQHLPRLVEDAQRAAARCDHAARDAEQAPVGRGSAPARPAVGTTPEPDRGR